jgi:UDP-glucose 4-epimerase
VARRFPCQNAPASRELGWEPKITLEEGVKIMLANIEYWRQAPVWDVPKIQQATKTWFKYLDK